jgi:predicted nuclease of predicted toxin-antitoxin system
LQRANEHGALLVTEDKDFGELVYRQQLVHLGIVLIRLMGLASSTKADLVFKVFEKHGQEMSNAFTVIAPGALRIRKPQP